MCLSYELVCDNGNVVDACLFHQDKVVQVCFHLSLSLFINGIGTVGVLFIPK